MERCSTTGKYIIRLLATGRKVRVLEENLALAPVVERTAATHGKQLG